MFSGVFLKEKRLDANPWRALTLEWQTSSPPAIENFTEEPILWSGPYDYGIDSEAIDGEETVGRNACRGWL